MYYHFAIRRWIFWAAVLGVGIGIYVLGHLAFQEQVTHADVAIAFGLGAKFWIMFSLVAWVMDGIEVGASAQQVSQQHDVEAPAPSWGDQARQDALRAHAVDSMTLESAPTWHRRSARPVYSGNRVS